ncbi:hypothetical protein GCM10025777_20300 [Membranihabitans marinus]
MCVRILLTAVSVLAMFCLKGQNFDGYVNLGNQYSAALTALSGSNGSQYDSDANVWTLNPALLTTKQNPTWNFNSFFHPGEISEFSIGYSRALDSVWPIAFNLQRTSFGTSSRYDAEGQYMGEFSAADHRISAATSRQLSDKIYIGLLMNYTWRRIDIYHSHVFMLGIGGQYLINDYNSIGLTIHQLGLESKPYISQNNATTIDLSLYGSRKLQYLPLQVFLKLQKLNQWNQLDYSNPFVENTIEFTDQEEKIDSRMTAFVKEFFAHVVIGGEFAFGRNDNIYLRFSYDHLRNKQLGIDNIRSLEGISLGFGLQLKKIKFDYAWEKIYFNAAAHQISIQFSPFSNNNQTSAVLPKGF